MVITCGFENSSQAIVMQIQQFMKKGLITRQYTM